MSNQNKKEIGGNLNKNKIWTITREWRLDP